MSKQVRLAAGTLQARSPSDQAGFALALTFGVIAALGLVTEMTFDGGPGPFLCTNPAAISPGATPVPAGNAAFILADSIAACVGRSLTAVSKHTTVKLFSPTPGFLFSAISRNTATTGDLRDLP